MTVISFEFSDIIKPSVKEMKTDFSVEHFDHHFFETEIKNVEINKSSVK